MLYLFLNFFIQIVASEGFTYLDSELILIIADEIAKTFDRAYRPTQFVAEILSTLHLLKEKTLAGMRRHREKEGTD
jgi:hypothetical protein